MGKAAHDANRVPSLIGVSPLNVKTPIPVYVDPTTHRMYVDMATSGMALPEYDYVSMAIAPAGTETWTFKLGGASGTLVATVVVVYTDASRADISTVTLTLP